MEYIDLHAIQWEDSTTKVLKNETFREWSTRHFEPYGFENILTDKKYNKYKKLFCVDNFK